MARDRHSSHLTASNNSSQTSFSSGEHVQQVLSLGGGEREGLGAAAGKEEPPAVARRKFNAGRVVLRCEKNTGCDPTGGKHAGGGGGGGS